MSCQRAQGFLESVGGKVTSLQDAKKSRIGPEDALKLARSMAKVVAAKGKRVETFDMTANAPDDESLLKHLIGPSGFLRAPAATVGQTLVIGFNENVYHTLIGSRS
ncbi:MAG TPA: ArsC family (seleno)protein [Gemmataceae bacterium]|nr:ArsC family (seleno)protein [Gemmataceae bacterium]